MFRPLRIVLDRLVQHGCLTLIDADGLPNQFGDGVGGRIVARIADGQSERAIAFDPELAIGEAYMRGSLVMVEGSVYDLIALLMRNLSHCDFGSPAVWRALKATRMAARRLAQFNPGARSRRNVRHHYDIDGRIYDLFLDPERQYSCAYFTPGAELDEAQRAKQRHLVAKLLLNDGQRVLDIGCGWGGMALHMARQADVDVTGITLSDAQMASAQNRARREGLSHRAHFVLEDYRRVAGHYNRIVSVGMFEHVGIGHYTGFFNRIRDLLTDDGVAVVHSIGRSDGPGFTNPFIAKYIFPGGYFPALSEVLPLVERSGLILCDVEILRLHYAETLKAWRTRFVSRWDEAVAISGEEFCRMWEFYLAGSEAAFRHQGLVVFQLQLARNIGTVPLTRDYIAAAERMQAYRNAHAGEAPRMAGE